MRLDTYLKVGGRYPSQGFIFRLGRALTPQFAGPPVRRIRSGDGGMAVLAALMASRRGRTRWGRAAGLRAPRFGVRVGR